MRTWVRYLAIVLGALRVPVSVPAGSRRMLRIGRSYFEQTDETHGIRFRWRCDAGYAELFAGGRVKLTASCSTEDVIRLGFPGASKVALPAGEQKRAGVAREWIPRASAYGSKAADIYHAAGGIETVWGRNVVVQRKPSVFQRTSAGVVSRTWPLCRPEAPGR